MSSHDYVRHTQDCLEEALTTVHLARQDGQLPPEKEEKLTEGLERLAEMLAPEGKPD
jgi:uncharacterized coiled-coil DUF342 family protein